MCSLVRSLLVVVMLLGVFMPTVMAAPTEQVEVPFSLTLSDEEVAVMEQFTITTMWTPSAQAVRASWSLYLDGQRIRGNDWHLGSWKQDQMTMASHTPRSMIFVLDWEEYDSDGTMIDRGMFTKQVTIVGDRMYFHNSVTSDFVVRTDKLPSGGFGLARMTNIPETHAWLGEMPENFSIHEGEYARATFHDVPPGDYWIWLELPGGNSVTRWSYEFLSGGNVQFDLSLGFANAPGMIFDVEASPASVQVVDSDYHPVAGIRVELRLDNGITLNKTTNESGLASFEGFEPGHHTLAFNFRGGETIISANLAKGWSGKGSHLWLQVTKSQVTPRQRLPLVIAGTNPR